MSKGTGAMATRKVVEAEFHDRLRDPALAANPELYAKLTSNKKWYEVTGHSRDFIETYLRQHSPGARALDFEVSRLGCGRLVEDRGAIGTGKSPGAAVPHQRSGSAGIER